MTPRKPKGWLPPSGLKIEICVERGSIYFKADATPADALNVARMLTVMCRQITNEAPDLLPIADSVPGDVLAYDWAEEFGDGAKAKPHKNVGF